MIRTTTKAILLMITTAITFSLVGLSPLHSQIFLQLLLGIGIPAWLFSTWAMFYASQQLLTVHGRSQLLDDLIHPYGLIRVKACFYLGVVCGNRFGIILPKSSILWHKWLSTHGHSMFWDPCVSRVLCRDTDV